MPTLTADNLLEGGLHGRGARSIGKTLSPFNADLLIERLRDRLMGLDDDLVVLPGHGPPSSLGIERRFNLGFEEGYSGKVTAPYDFFV